MTQYRTLFKATGGSYRTTDTLYVGTVEAPDMDEAAAIASANLEPEYTLLGVAADTRSTNGHGASLKSIVSVPVPTPSVNGSLKLSDL